MTRGEQRRGDVEREDHLPVEDAGDAGGALVVADGVEQPAEAGAAQGEDEQRGDRDEEQQRVRDAPGQAGAEPGEDVGDLGAGGDDGALVDLQAAGADQAGAERHDQRMDAEDADADAVGEADQHAPGTSASSERDRRVVVHRLGRHDEGGHRRDGGDREVDAAGQHGQRLAAGEHRERDRELHGVGDPALVDDAGAQDLQDDDEQRSAG